MSPQDTRPLRQRLAAALSDPLAQFQLSLLTLLLLAIAGTIGYAVLEQMSVLDAFYMTVITLTTVGFGEVEPLTTAGRMFTIALILVGVGLATWTIRNAAELALGHTFWLSVRRRRMMDRIDDLENHYIVCGYGRVGSRIARDLQARGERCVVIDQSDELGRELLAAEMAHVSGDATRDDVLLAAGVERARGLVAALDSDANNVLTVLTAKGLNPRLLLAARSNDPESVSKLRRAGADRVISPDATGGHRLALALLRPTVHDFLNRVFDFGVELDVDVGQITIPDDSPFSGQTIAGCDLRGMRNVSILAIRGPDGEFTLNPSAQRVIEVGETLILIGPAESIYELEALYGEEG